MFYILKSEQTYNKTPEITYADGVTMQFKKGYYIFDTETANEHFYDDGKQISISGQKHTIYDKMDNRYKIEASFLKLKIKEMNNNSFNFFMPTSYKKYVDNYNKLIEDYPEYLI